MVIYGGGPSLNQADIDYAKTRFKRIACNDAFLLDPECDVLCWCDSRWYLWNNKELHKHRGQWRITWKHVPQITGAGNILILKQLNPPPWLHEDPGIIVANNTGQGALQLAYHFGAKRILLLGFDMRRIDNQMNWHQRHKQSTDPARMRDIFMPAIQRLGKELARKGVEVINCTPNSALTCFPYRDLREIEL